MKIISTIWKCGACLEENEIQIKKPNIFNPIILSKRCANCNSKFMIRFLKEASKENVIWTLLRGELTPIGAEYCKKRLEDKINKNT